MLACFLEDAACVHKEVFMCGFIFPSQYTHKAFEVTHFMQATQLFLKTA